MLVLRWSQRAHCWFLGRPKGHIRVSKGHSALWKRPSQNPVVCMSITQWYRYRYRSNTHILLSELEISVKMGIGGTLGPTLRTVGHKLKDIESESTANLNPPTQLG